MGNLRERRAGLVGTLSEWPVYFGLLTKVMPSVSRELKRWENLAHRIPDLELRRQALASIRAKRFHCFGGAAFALLNASRIPELVRAIVAIQTISDYLDNLCDRVTAASLPEADDGMPSLSASSVESSFDISTLRPADSTQVRLFYRFMRLHEAMLCAVDPSRPVSDYYELYPVKHPQKDGGYLNSLVQASRAVLTELDNYEAVRPTVVRLATLYSEMQSLKHLLPDIRDGFMHGWFIQRSKRTCLTGFGGFQGCNLKWWEYGAAAGSTLGIFTLLSYSSRPRDGQERLPKGRSHPGKTFSESQARALGRVYFPAISALHILLDYYIDQEEDKASGDLNFVSYYSSGPERLNGLRRFLDLSLAQVDSELQEPWFHRAVVKGLLAMYLSDPKVKDQGFLADALKLTAAAGFPAESLRKTCGFIRAVLGF